MTTRTVTSPPIRTSSGTGSCRRRRQNSATSDRSPPVSWASRSRSSAVGRSTPILDAIHALSALGEAVEHRADVLARLPAPPLRLFLLSGQGSAFEADRTEPAEQGLLGLAAFGEQVGLTLKVVLGAARGEVVEDVRGEAGEEVRFAVVPGVEADLTNARTV
ncbi:hypothetical protein ACXIZN_10445 [Amycolatopsis sp. TRM77291]